MNQRLLAILAILVVSVLASCADSREVNAVSSAELLCTSCHGDPARPGPAPIQAAPPGSWNGGNGGAHLAHLERGVACGACHPVPASPSHADGVVDVVFSGAAVANGATPAYAGGTCSGVYCHGANLGKGGNLTAPTWSGGHLGCDACHGAPPPGHAPGSTACAACHPGTVKPDGTIDVAGGLHANGLPEGLAGHAAGWADPAQHGGAAKAGLGACRACHGANLDGVGGTAGSCATCHANAGSASWQSNCTFCHGTKIATYTAASLVQAAPPRGTRGETAVTARAVGAHQKHLTGGTLGPAVACADCHAVPTDLAHVDATAAVTFGPAARRDGANPVWNGASCASTSCHGGTMAGGSNTAPTWTGGATQTACGSCHGIPPPTGHVAATTCDGCHGGYGPASVNLTVHMNGVVDASGGGGHGAGWGAGAVHGRAANRDGLAGCKTCHGANLDGVGGTAQSCTTCHASGWATSCTFCHGTGDSAAPPVDTQGLSSTENVSVGAHAKHVNPAWMAAPACTLCHPDRTGSNVISDAAHVDGRANGADVILGAAAGAGATYTRTSASAASCTSVYCHSTAARTSPTYRTVAWASASPTAMTCSSCHAAVPSTGRHSKHNSRTPPIGCGVCHGSGYSSNGVARATHVNGTREVDVASTGWNATNRNCNNSCHDASEGTW